MIKQIRKWDNLTIQIEKWDMTSALLVLSCGMEVNEHRTSTLLAIIIIWLGVH